MKINTTGIKAFKKDIRRLNTNINKATTRVVNKAVKGFQLTFDEAEIIPYSEGTSGQIVIGTFDEEESPRALEAILATETTKLLSEAERDLQEEIKGVLKL